ncbi:hypothetical protein Pla52n_17540 [Stieleria varia]|uniref:Uncharacterized protein n=1 Tax=Stieleria varia TaxID=2528005 RepID=A0A5C6B430_9BACT|nr:hypothetical protein Pla52n_17540 [Stieleria varia]
MPLAFGQNAEHLPKLAPHVLVSRSALRQRGWRHIFRGSEQGWAQTKKKTFPQDSTREGKAFGVFKAYSIAVGGACVKIGWRNEGRKTPFRGAARAFG